MMKLRAPLVVMAVLSILWPAVMSAQAATPDFADPAFQKVWDRTDSLVASLQTTRTWYWGPFGFFSTHESYSESPSGQRSVQYFDKSRMEINNPDADPSSQWYVTNGLLVKELVSGRMQVGNNQFVTRQSAQVTVAGDPLADNPNAPTYASFKNLASLNGEQDKRKDVRTGQVVTATINVSGTTGYNTSLDKYDGGTLIYYDNTLGHNIPEVFWQFMNASGKVKEGGQVVTKTVIDWIFAMGYPITEPYWARVKINGVAQDVLIQLFERRVLTYTPANSAGWQVEMGNVGQHYFKWRYEVTLDADPSSGPAGTTFTFAGHGFDPGEKVAAWYSAPDGLVYGYESQTVADQSGQVQFIFQSSPTAPAGQWAITAQGGASNRVVVAYFQITTPKAELISTPASGSKGVEFTLKASHFQPKEQVSLSVVAPDNQTLIMVGQLAANDDGDVEFSWTTGSQTQTGRWAATARGAESGKVAQTHFDVTS